MDHSLEDTQHSQGKYRCLYTRIIYLRVDVRLIHARIGSLVTEGRGRTPQMEKGAKRMDVKINLISTSGGQNNYGIFFKLLFVILIIHVRIRNVTRAPFPRR